MSGGGVLLQSQHWGGGARRIPGARWLSIHCCLLGGPQVPVRDLVSKTLSRWLLRNGNWCWFLTSTYMCAHMCIRARVRTHTLAQESITVDSVFWGGPLSKWFSFWKCYFDKRACSNMDEPHFVSYFTFHTAFKNIFPYFHNRCWRSFPSTTFRRKCHLI